MQIILFNANFCFVEMSYASQMKPNEPYERSFNYCICLPWIVYFCGILDTSCYVINDYTVDCGSLGPFIYFFIESILSFIIDSN